MQRNSHSSTKVIISEDMNRHRKQQPDMRTTHEMLIARRTCKRWHERGRSPWHTSSRECTCRIHAMAKGTLPVTVPNRDAFCCHTNARGGACTRLVHVLDGVRHLLVLPKVLRQRLPGLLEDRRRADVNLRHHHSDGNLRRSCVLCRGSTKATTDVVKRVRPGRSKTSGRRRGKRVFRRCRERWTRRIVLHAIHTSVGKVTAALAISARGRRVAALECLNWT